MNDLLMFIKKINLGGIVSNTNKTLKTIKKAIPIYKEVSPYIKKEKKLFNREELFNDKINLNKEKKEYNDTLTFFH